MQRVSDEDLEKLLEWAEQWSGAEDSHWRDAVLAIKELQCLRSDAELAKYETRIAELNKHLQDAVNKVGEQAATIAMQGEQLAQLTTEREAVQKILDQPGNSIDLAGESAALYKDYEATCVRECFGETWHAALTALVAAAGKRIVNES